jgi:hypothetical protein
MRASKWPMVALAAIAVGALAAGGILGFLVGFVAILLIVDRAWPITGLLLTDAQHAYTTVARQRRLAALRRRLERRPRDDGRLPCLAADVEAGAQRRTLAIQEIALDSIVGTTEADKAQAFDDRFRPPEWSRGRWQLVWMARSRGTALPPISVYRVGDRHYVCDGHHRVSVARALGESTIEAEIVVLDAVAHHAQR